MNISDYFLSFHNFMTLPPQKNTLPRIYDFFSNLCRQMFRRLGVKIILSLALTFLPPGILLWQHFKMHNVRSSAVKSLSFNLF